MTGCEYDVVVVGSGACGATIARELSRHGKKVLLLERGSQRPVRETMLGMLAVAREVSIGEGLKATVARTVGGSTSLYFGKCMLPTAETFRKLGVDLSTELAELRTELPLAELPDEFVTPQSALLRDSVRQLGYSMKRNLMLVDQSKCSGGNYSYEAKWQARSYVTQAVNNGARLITGATVEAIIVEEGRAVGVSYRAGKGMASSRVCRAYARKIVLSAGPFASARLLMACGVKNVGAHGFFCHPAYMVCGMVPGLKGRSAFIGNLDLDIDLEEGVLLGDATMHASLFKLVMLTNLKLRYLLSHSNALSIGVSLSDTLSGEIMQGGRYYKRLTQEEVGKLDRAGAVAVKVLRNAGARNIFRTKLAAGAPGGVLRVGEQLDEGLQTSIRNLHVCDHSLISDAKIPPTLTLLCLGKYLAKRLLAFQADEHHEGHAAAATTLKGAPATFASRISTLERG